jgi:type IV secretory pathway VirB2 component (pilin)
MAVRLPPRDRRYDAPMRGKRVPAGILLILVLGFASAAAWLATQAPHVAAATCRAPWETVLKEIAQTATCTSAGQIRFGLAALCGLVSLSAATRLVIRFDD